MVVPSEMNSDIFNLTMEDSNVKESALSSPNTSNNSESETETAEKIVERDKTSEESDHNRGKYTVYGFSNPASPLTLFYVPFRLKFRTLESILIPIRHQISTVT